MINSQKFGIFDAYRREYVTASGGLTTKTFLAVVFDEPRDAREFARKKRIPEDTLIVAMGI